MRTREVQTQGLRRQLGKFRYTVCTSDNLPLT